MPKLSAVEVDKAIEDVEPEWDDYGLWDDFEYEYEPFDYDDYDDSLWSPFDVQELGGEA